MALVGQASGLVEPGGSATATRPGVNELRVEGNKPNAEDAQRILASIREARKKADLVIVYEHNHVFPEDFRVMMLEELPDRLVPPTWLKQWTHDEVDAGADIIVMHGAPLLHGVEIYHGKPIFFDLGNFIFQAPPIDVLLDEPIDWESVVAYVEFQGRHLQVDSIPAHRDEQDRQGPSRHAGRAHQQSLPANAWIAEARHRRAGALYPGAPGRLSAAFRNHG